MRMSEGNAAAPLRRPQQPSTIDKGMRKTNYISLVAVCTVFLGILSGCGQSPLHTETSENPYLQDAHQLQADLISHMLVTASAASPGTAPGEAVLQALDTFEPLGLDLDLPEAARVLASLPSARKGGDASPGTYEYYQGALLKAAESLSASSSAEALRTVEREAVATLDADGGRAIQALGAFMESQYRFFTSSDNRPQLEELARALGDLAGSSGKTRGVWFRGVQDAGSPPPNWVDFFDPGEWWSNTLTDATRAGTSGTVLGAAVGCLAGGAPTAGLGCGPVGAALGAVGGGLGVLIGGGGSAIMHYASAVWQFGAAEDTWCAEQNNLNPVLRDNAFEERCDDPNRNHQ